MVIRVRGLVLGRDTELILMLCTNVCLLFILRWSDGKQVQWLALCIAYVIRDIRSFLLTKVTAPKYISVAFVMNGFNVSAS